MRKAFVHITRTAALLNPWVNRVCMNELYGRAHQCYQMIDGRLEELGREPRDVLVVVELETYESMAP